MPDPLQQPPLQPNPYAPSALLEDEKKPIAENRDSNLVSNYTVGFQTILVVIVCGGFFGILVSFFTVGQMLLTRSSWGPAPGFPEALLSLFYISAIAFGLGMVTAAFGAVPIVPACLWAYSALQQDGRPWTPASIRVFGSIAGATTGFACVAVPTLLSGWLPGAAYGLVPAVFAAITVPIMLFRLATRCRISLAKEASRRRQEIRS